MGLLNSLVAACARLVRPGGHVFFSTLNRNVKSFLLAIVAAEHVLGMLPRGTHRYDTFIRPSELDRWCRDAGLRLHELAGITYRPLTGRFRIGDDVGVNYIAWYRSDPE